MVGAAASDSTIPLSLPPPRVVSRWKSGADPIQPPSLVVAGCNDSNRRPRFPPRTLPPTRASNARSVSRCHLSPGGSPIRRTRLATAPVPTIPTAADRPWLRALTARLRRDPGLASRLVIEITETAALYDIEESIRFVAALRQAGCRVALDDFGAGHASLRHLQSLPVDTVKIDGALIRDVARNPENRVFLRHLVGLAAGFGFKTVAECVETAEDAAILREERVDYLQGHYCGRPRFEPDWEP